MKKKALFCFFLVFLRIILFMWKRQAILDRRRAFGLRAGARSSDVGVVLIGRWRAGHRSCKQHFVQCRLKSSQQRERGTHEHHPCLRHKESIIMMITIIIIIIIITDIGWKINKGIRRCIKAV